MRLLLLTSAILGFVSAELDTLHYLHLPSSSGSPPSLVVFGDSYSDTGLTADSLYTSGFSNWIQLALKSSQVLPDFPYQKGRFSNGPIWAEYVASELNISLQSFAVGGATTGAYPWMITLPSGYGDLAKKTRILTPNLFQQINLCLLLKNGRLDEEGVYVLFIGYNDYLSNIVESQPEPEFIVEMIREAVTLLNDHGARKFILFNLSKIKSLTTRGKTKDSHQEEHNNLLNELVENFTSSHPETYAKVFDYNATASAIYERAELFGLKRNYTACFDIRDVSMDLSSVLPCKDPETHLFWDQLHPTAKTSKLIAHVFVKTMRQLLFMDIAKGLTPESELRTPSQILEDAVDLQEEMSAEISKITRRNNKTSHG